MLAAVLPAILGIIGPIIQRAFPDPAEAARQQAAFVAQITNALESADSNQTSINAKEAENPNVFVSGWRPFIGWVCGSACAWSYIVGPVLTWGSRAVGHPVDLPALDTSALMNLTFGMLGMAGLRTYERLAGVVPPQPGGQAPAAPAQPAARR